MTMWIPKIENAHGPIYLAIADALEADINDGVLDQGDRLPPQRTKFARAFGDLAFVRPIQAT